MSDHVLRSVLILVPTICTITAFVIAIKVIAPRRKEHRPVRRPFTVALVIAGVGLCAAITNFVITLNS